MNKSASFPFSTDLHKNRDLNDSKADVLAKYFMVDIINGQLRTSADYKIILKR
jgi:hypothetical protein